MATIERIERRCPHCRVLVAVIEGTRIIVQPGQHVRNLYICDACA
jgi:hypothetical protein